MFNGLPTVGVTRLVKVIIVFTSSLDMVTELANVFSVTQ